MTQKEVKIIGSAQKCLQILSYMATLNQEVSITDLVESLKINKSTMHHYLATLVMEKYVIQNQENKKYRIGPEAFRVGECYLRKDFPYQDIDAVLRELQNEVSESVYFYIYSGNKATCVLAREVYSPLHSHNPIGNSVPMHASASGKVFLAFLGEGEREKILEQTGMPRFTKNTITDREVLNKELMEIRLRSFAANDGEHDESITIAAPVFGFGDKIIATVSVSGPPSHMTDKRIKDMIKIVVKYGRVLSEMVHNVVL